MALKVGRKGPDFEPGRRRFRRAAREGSVAGKVAAGRAFRWPDGGPRIRAGIPPRFAFPRSTTDLELVRTRGDGRDTLG